MLLTTEKDPLTCCHRRSGILHHRAFGRGLCKTDKGCRVQQRSCLSIFERGTANKIAAVELFEDFMYLRRFLPSDGRIFALLKSDLTPTFVGGGKARVNLYKLQGTADQEGTAWLYSGLNKLPYSGLQWSSALGPDCSIAGCHCMFFLTLLMEDFSSVLENKVLQHKKWFIHFSLQIHPFLVMDALITGCSLVFNLSGSSQHLSEYSSVKSTKRSRPDIEYSSGFLK